MAINETIITGRKFRRLIDVANKTWQRISYWTKSSDVEFNDGKDAETKVGSINGITSDLNCEDESIAISAKAIKELSENFFTEGNEIGDALASLGVSVPIGASLSDIANIIRTTLFMKADVLSFSGEFNDNTTAGANLIAVIKTCTLDGDSASLQENNIVFNQSFNTATISFSCTWKKGGSVGYDPSVYLKILINDEVVNYVKTILSSSTAGDSGMRNASVTWTGAIAAGDKISFVHTNTNQEGRFGKFTNGTFSIIAQN